VEPSKASNVHKVKSARGLTHCSKLMWGHLPH